MRSVARAQALVCSSLSMICSPIPSPLLFIFVTKSPISLMLSTFKEDGYHLNILLACSPRKFSSRKSVRWASPCPPATLWMSSNAAFTVCSSSSEACSQPKVNISPPINAKKTWIASRAVPQSSVVGCEISRSLTRPPRVTCSARL